MYSNNHRVYVHKNIQFTEKMSCLQEIIICYTHTCTCILLLFHSDIIFSTLKTRILHVDNFFAFDRRPFRMWCSWTILFINRRMHDFGLTIFCPF